LCKSVKFIYNNRSEFYFFIFYFKNFPIYCHKQTGHFGDTEFQVYATYMYFYWIDELETTATATGPGDDVLDAANIINCHSFFGWSPASPTIAILAL